MGTNRETVISASAQANSLKRVLNAGSGPHSSRKLHPAFVRDAWQEIRIDIDPRAKPDMVVSITDMKSSFEPESFDAIWSSHTLEHLYAHEVPIALAEFKRVLKPDGFALVTSPDLETVASLILITVLTISLIRHLPGRSHRSICCLVILVLLLAVTVLWPTKLGLPVPL